MAVKSAKLSVIVPLGYIDQVSLFNKELGDEFGHAAGLTKAKKEVELILVDRAWPTRWDLARKALGDFVEKTMYIPPRPSNALRMSYRACGRMRNSGAIVSTGDIVVFVDDYIYVDGEVADKCIVYYEDTGELLTPVYKPFPKNIKDCEKTLVKGGHNPGIYMAGRNHFVTLNGFDEAFSGCAWETDTDFEWRLDALLFRLAGTRQGLRKIRRDCVWPVTGHANGRYPEKERVSPWPGSNDRHTNIRCNKAYYNRISKPRRERGIYAALQPSKEELARLWYGCNPNCQLCFRKDRSEQVASYHGIFKADYATSYLMSMWYHDKQPQYGCFNPWE